MVRIKSRDNRSPFPSQNRTLSSWLFGCCALRRFEHGGSKACEGKTFLTPCKELYKETNQNRLI